MDSLTDLVFGFFNNIVSLANQLYGFLFSEVSFGDWTFQVWTLITGGLMITFIVSWLFGKIIGWGWFS